MVFPFPYEFSYVFLNIYQFGFHHLKTVHPRSIVTTAEHRSLRWPSTVRLREGPGVGAAYLLKPGIRALEIWGYYILHG